MHILQLRRMLRPAAIWVKLQLIPYGSFLFSYNKKLK
jgi:hypothetical protein